MATRIDKLIDLSLQANSVDYLAGEHQRAIEQRDMAILEALDAGLSERTVAAAVRLSRSYINKVRRIRDAAGRAAA